MAENPRSNQVKGQVAVVTGASRGIGRAIALRLAVMGFSVVASARNSAELQELAAAAGVQGGRVFPRVADMRDPAAVESLIQSTIREQGRIDVLVNNAGVGRFGMPLHETSLADWDATFETNLRAVYLAMRAVTPHMMERKTGQIINIASLAAHNPVPMAAAYAASKWALKGLSITAAEELRGYGIRVSLVCPGSVETELSPALTRGKDTSKMLQPDDIAHIVAMLATQETRSFISEVLIRPTQKP